MTTSVPFVDSLDVGVRSPGYGPGRPHVVLVIGRTEPRPRAMYSAVWLGRRLGAEMLVVAPVEYRPPLDELVAARVSTTQEVVTRTAGHLVEEGVDAAGTVLVARDGLGLSAIDDFVDEHEADLVAIASRHGSWFRVFPGSEIAHHLTREGRRPVLVIPDHGPGLGTRLGHWLGRSHEGATQWRP